MGIGGRGGLRGSEGSRGLRWAEGWLGSEEGKRSVRGLGPLMIFYMAYMLIHK